MASQKKKQEKTNKKSNLLKKVGLGALAVSALLGSYIVTTNQKSQDDFSLTKPSPYTAQVQETSPQQPDRTIYVIYQQHTSQGYDELAGMSQEAIQKSKTDSLENQISIYHIASNLHEKYGVTLLLNEGRVCTDLSDLKEYGRTNPEAQKYLDIIRKKGDKALEQILSGYSSGADIAGTLYSELALLGYEIPLLSEQSEVQTRRITQSMEQEKMGIITPQQGEQEFQDAKKILDQIDKERTQNALDYAVLFGDQLEGLTKNKDAIIVIGHGHQKDFEQLAKKPEYQKLKIVYITPKGMNYQ